MTLATLSGVQNSSNLKALNYVTGSNLMIVKFRSDASAEKRGFRASWKTEPIRCGGELFAMPSAQVITNPLFPEPAPGGLECVYVITAPVGKTITLEVVELDLEPLVDSILVRDGPLASDPLLTSLTGSADTLNSKFIVSTNNRIYLYLTTGLGSRASKKFALRFRAGCELEYQAEAGNISSPAFGVANYPHNQNCVYRIARPSGGSLSLHFKDFDVANDDHLQLFDGHDSESGVPLHPTPGFNNDAKPTNLVLTASSGKLAINFNSNALNNGKGWSAIFSADCPPLKIGRGAIASSRESMFGARVVFTCPSGQEFANGAIKLVTDCQEGGKWSLPRIPQCQERYCGPVPQIDNGFAVAATNVTFRGIATYQCYAGFGFASGFGTESIRCNDDGKWGTLPTCLASTCPPLGETPHALQTTLAGTGRNFGTIIRFNCEPGYVRSGVPVILCESIGQWSALPPLCERAQCPSLPTIENGFIVDSKRKYFFEDEARIQCHRGFKLDGLATIKCGANQTFDDLPKCRDIDECTSPAACDGASTECTNTPGGFFCKFCPTLFEMPVNSDVRNLFLFTFCPQANVNLVSSRTSTADPWATLDCHRVSFPTRVFVPRELRLDIARTMSAWTPVVAGVVPCLEWARTGCKSIFEHRTSSVASASNPSLDTTHLKPIPSRFVFNTPTT